MSHVTLLFSLSLPQVQLTAACQRRHTRVSEI